MAVKVTYPRDITVEAADIVDGAVTNAKLADMATARFKGRITSGTGDPEDLTAAQATALLETVTSGAKGLAPASGGGTTNFLRADGTWAAPAGSGGAVSWSKMDETPASPNAKNEEMTSALTGVTWIASSGTPTNQTWTTIFDDTSAPANPRYNVSGTLPGMLVMQPTGGGRLIAYKAFAPGSGTKWAVLAKVHLIGATGADDRIHVGVCKDVPVATANEMPNGQAADYRESGSGAFTLRHAHPATGAGEGASADAGTAYLAITGRTDNSIVTWVSYDGLSWRAPWSTSGLAWNGNVNYAFLFVLDGHNNQMPVIAVVEYWRFLEGDNNLFAMMGG